MKVAAIVLAAGGSTRFGQPKQLLNFRGQPLVRRIVEAALAAGCSPVVVVVGRDREAIATGLRDLEVQLVPNENWQEGIGSSIRVGLNALPEAAAFILAACDQPHVDADLVARLIAARRPIAASAYSGTFGVPALFSARYREELLALPNEHGAKVVIARHLAEVATIDFPDGAIDIDTPGDYRALQASP